MRMGKPLPTLLSDKERERGIRRVEVTAPGFTGEVVFCASAQDIQAGNISSLVPITQMGTYGELLSEPLKVYVSDRGGNPLPNAAVQFQVLEGEGTIFRTSEITLISDDSGRVDAPLVMGTNESLTSYQVAAVVLDSDPPLMTFFEGEIVMPGAEADTTFSGVVLDEGNRPLPGVEVFIQGEDRRVRTDAEGQFLLTDVPIGDHLLEVEGSTTSVPGSWPHLEFNVVTIAGQENHLEQPIYLLRMDDDSARLVGGDQDVVVELAGIPGATLTVFANSVTGPNGEREIPLTWTQVNRERVPMPPPLGGQFSVATTVQPANTVFDPPARLQFPNLEGEPGQQIEMFSFDHDLMDYVSIGTGTVSDDGAVVASDEGFGLVRAGWTGASPPAADCTGIVTVRPDDTPCEEWRSLPAPRCAGGLRYVRNRARIFNITATATNLDTSGGPNAPRADLTVFTGNQIQFNASAESEVCRLVQFQWDFGDESSFVVGASVTHSFSRVGDFTVTMQPVCRGCPDNNPPPKTIRVKVVEQKFVEFTDSNGRRSIDGALQIVPSGSEEVIQFVARTRNGGADGPVSWRVVGPGSGVRNFEGRAISVPFDNVTLDLQDSLGLGSQSTIAVLQATKEVHQVFCDDDRVGTITVYPNRAEQFNFTGAGIQNVLTSVREFVAELGSLGGPLLDNGGQSANVQALRGQVAFKYSWEECGQNNLAAFVTEIQGGFNPFLAIEGELRIPLRVLVSAVGGPTAAAISTLLGRIEAVADIQTALVIVPSGSVSIVATGRNNPCGGVEGTATGSGSIKLDVRVIGERENFAEARFSGSSGVTVSSTLEFLKPNPSFNNMKVTFDGISGGLVVILKDDALGLLGLRGLETENTLFQGTLVAPSVIYGPTTIFTSSD